MKALHLTLDASISQSGKETVFYNMLAEFSKYWERIDILCPRIDGGQERNIHHNVFIHPSSNQFLLQPWFVYKQGSKIIKQQHLDVIILHSGPPFFTDIGALFLHWRFGIPIMGEIMHIVGYPKAADLTEKVFYWMTKWWWRFFQRYVKAIRVINSQDSLPKLVEWGIHRSKLHVIQANYIDHDAFKPIDMPKTNNSLLFVGRLEKNKGILELLDTLTLIKKQIPTIKLTIIGTGSLRTKIEEKIKQLHLQQNIRIIPFLKSQQELVSYYNQTQILVITSYNEGGPRVALEAMACKTAVASTPVGIIKELIVNDENGIILDWNPIRNAQILADLLKQSLKLKNIAENGFKSVKNTNNIDAIGKYAKTYLEILS